MRRVAGRRRQAHPGPQTLAGSPADAAPREDAVRLEDIAAIEEALGRDEAEALRRIHDIIRRAREAAPPLPVPPASAPRPPRPWCETEGDDNEGRQP